jgi:hypothetical protein
MSEKPALLPDNISSTLFKPIEESLGESVDLNTTLAKRSIAEQIKLDIDVFVCAKEMLETTGFREHLGASVIGHSCNRYIWYHFHWFKPERFVGRLLRLFNRGHDEEPRIRYLLQGIGFEFYQTENGKQTRISDIEGHFGGSSDDIARCSRLGLDWSLIEYKTSGTGAGFNKLSEVGVAGAKERHFIQMSIYGYKLGLRYAVYITVNKNDDDLYVEIVELDWELAKREIEKAQELIILNNPPKRISEKRNYYICNQCPMQSICHDGDTFAVSHNCRSCKNSKPIENAQWFCSHWNTTIPTEAVIKGCTEWMQK